MHFAIFVFRKNGQPEIYLPGAHRNVFHDALDIIHSIGTRASVDIDISMPDDFDDIEDAKQRIFRVLKGTTRTIRTESL
jgi:hypothetical protein